MNFHHFQQALEKGFLDSSKKAKESLMPEFVINNKNRDKIVLNTLISSLQRCNEFFFSVAFLSKSGLAVLLMTLKELEKRNIKGKILVSQYLNFTQPVALKTLLSFKNIELKIVTTGNFHAKGYFFKYHSHWELMIGSSNLTANALTHNNEWNLKIHAYENSMLGHDILSTALDEFDRALTVNDDYLAYYEPLYLSQLQLQTQSMLNEKHLSIINPNKMQQEALENLNSLRKNGATRALIISATATGKTYLSAFDVKSLNSKRFLFIVHRETIAKKACETFKTIFKNERSYGIFCGDSKPINADFIFSTIQTIHKEENYSLFSQTHFDYIVIDETHRSGAKSYQTILNYFKPKFLLGMTATPERSDGFDIFEQFHHHIAYEIRLKQALEADMLVPFHYYGISEIAINGTSIDDKTQFLTLVSKERIEHIINTITFYGTDTNQYRGLVFCRSIEESSILCEAFNKRGLSSIALSGNTHEHEREQAIKSLESDQENRINFIFTVDIFNEGVDIPKVNLIILLRPTQSAIVYVQQLGRGLRKSFGKEYLTILDFIGNYDNNFLIPIALYGDESYSKDHLRKLLISGSCELPGECTLQFDPIAKEKIFHSISSSTLDTSKRLKEAYTLLKNKLGRVPMMCDFLNYQSIDPAHFISYKRSFFHYLTSINEKVVFQEELILTPQEESILRFFTDKLLTPKRITESIILTQLLKNGFCSIEQLNQHRFPYGYNNISSKEIESLLACFNTTFFIKETKTIKELNSFFYNAPLIFFENNHFYLGKELKKFFNNRLFAYFLKDHLTYVTTVFKNSYQKKYFTGGFLRYEKYQREDVFRLLHYLKNPNPQNVGGYLYDKINHLFPIFITLHKSEGIRHSINYDDRFLSPDELTWMSKNRRTLNSPEIQALQQDPSLRVMLFVKKDESEESSFYYLGDMTPIVDSFIQSNLDNSSVVSVRFKLHHAVEEKLYHYLTEFSLN